MLFSSYNWSALHFKQTPHVHVGELAAVDQNGANGQVFCSLGNSCDLQAGPNIEGPSKSEHRRQNDECRRMFRGMGQARKGARTAQRTVPTGEGEMQKAE